MPGYDKCRFVDLSQLEEEELTCGICLEILKNPCVVPCCRQTYCYGCISEWLNYQKSCPNDRHRLTDTQLYDPQRLVLNLLAKLRIRCLFHSKGCQIVSDLQSVVNHEDNCLFNPNRRCNDCGIKVSESTHNCVNSLKLLNTSLSEEMIELKSEILRLKSEIKSLKENNGNNNNIQYDHINQVMASARTRISYPEITYCSISSTFRNKAINKSKEAILTFNTFLDITDFLNIEFNSDMNNETQNRKWYTIAHSIHCGESLVRNPNGYIDLRFGQLRIAIFSAGPRLESSLKTNYDELKR